MTPPTQGPQRLHFVDLLRGLAVFVMIETHVCNALLVPSLKEESFFKVLTFFNGLVAPSFLFCAGFAFAIVARRRWAEYLSLRPSLWRYVSRILFILVIGYTLHVPVFSLKRLANLADSSAWLPFYQADILQTITVTLLLLIILVLISRREDVFLVMGALVTLFCIFAAPVIRELDFSNVPVWVSPYLTTHVKTQFPLLPWSAFLISGTLIGWWYLASGDPRKVIERLILYSSGAVLLAIIGEYAPVGVYPHHDFWNASPEFFFVRLGIVVLAMCGWWWWELRRPVGAGSVLSLFGRESLLVYVVHLLIVYGSSHEFSFVRMFGPTFHYLQCAGVFAGLTAAMYLMAYVWHSLKVRNAAAARYVQYAVIGGIVLKFLVD